MSQYSILDLPLILSAHQFSPAWSSEGFQTFSPCNHGLNSLSALLIEKS